MNRLVLHIVAVGFCFAAGQALQCYKCNLGLWNLCLTTETTCSAGENCFSGVGKAAGFMDIKMKGCLIRSECNATKEVTLPGNSSTTVYKMTKNCCVTDLCNAAPGRVGPPVLSMALAAAAAVFVANVAV